VKVTLVPSAIPGSGPEPFQYLTSFVLNDTVALDGGSLGFYGSPQEQAGVRHLFVSHSHIDHIASLPILAENAYEGKRECLTVYGSEAVLECLRSDVFNDRVWPDFFRLSSDDAAFLKAVPLEPGRAVEVGGLRLTPVPVNHVVPTLGFVVEDGGAAAVFPGDTGPTEEIWHAANRAPNLKAVYLEATFPSTMAWLADASMHLTPALFAQEVRKLTSPAALLAVHLKPRYRTQIIEELLALGLPNLEIARPGHPYCWGPADPTGPAPARRH
jgi:ribonuclease BN (tRNA processing enzyme)